MNEYINSFMKKAYNSIGKFTSPITAIFPWSKITIERVPMALQLNHELPHQRYV